MRGLAVALGDQPVGEERLQRGRERAHDDAPGSCSMRSLTSCEQLGDGFEVPVGAGRVDVPEIRRQQRHPPVDVLTGAMPVDQRVHGKGMPEIMGRGLAREPAPSNPTWRTSLMNVAFSSSRPIRRPRADRKNAGEGGVGKRASRRPRVAAQRGDRARVHRHLSLLVLLPGAHVHHAVHRRSTSARSSPRASPGRQPVTASSPISVS